MFNRSASRRQTQLITAGLAGLLALPVLSSATAPSRQVCAALLSPIVVGQSPSDPVELGCWASRREADASIGSGSATLSASLAGASATLIGIDYSGATYLGTQYLWYATNPAGCGDGSSYSSVMPSSFDNLTRSVQGFTGCGHNTHYDPPSASGASITCVSACSSMGAMAARTSFVRWAH
jgi:hypothetical protein